MQDATDAERIRQKYLSLSPVMNERVRRQWAASEARAVGWGGVSLVSLAHGLARNTIAAGMEELAHHGAHRREAVEMGSAIRAGGANRRHRPIRVCLRPWKRWSIRPRADTRESPLRWTCKSTGKLARERTRRDHGVSDRTVAALLKQAGYSLQANRKTREGARHPNRNAQFEYINAQAAAFLRGEGESA